MSFDPDPELESEFPPDDDAFFPSVGAPRAPPVDPLSVLFLSCEFFPEASFDFFALDGDRLLLDDLVPLRVGSLFRDVGG